MLNFSFENQTRIHFGEGQITTISNEIPKDAKVLVTYGGGSIKSNGVYVVCPDFMVLSHTRVKKRLFKTRETSRVMSLVSGLCVGCVCPSHSLLAYGL